MHRILSAAGLLVAMFLSSTAVGQDPSPTGPGARKEGRPDAVRPGGAAGDNRRNAKTHPGPKDRPSMNRPPMSGGKSPLWKGPPPSGRPGRHPPPGPPRALDRETGAVPRHPSHRERFDRAASGRPDGPRPAPDPAERAAQLERHRERVRARRANLRRNTKHKAAISSADHKKGRFAREQRKHIRRMARIRRLLRIAVDTGKMEQAAVLRELQKKEMNRHARTMKERYEGTREDRGATGPAAKEARK